MYSQLSYKYQLPEDAGVIYHYITTCLVFQICKLMLQAMGIILFFLLGPLGLESGFLLEKQNKFLCFYLTC